MDYRYILRRARQIVRFHKKLWLFGLLASLNSLWWLVGDMRLGGLPDPAQQWILDVASTPYGILAAAVLLFFMGLLGLGLAVLVALGRSALVSQANHIENMGRASLREGWEAAKERFKPVFWIRFLFALPALVIGMSGLIPYLLRAYVLYLPPDPAVEPAVFVQALGRLLFCLAPAAILAMLVAIPLSLVKRMAVRACVLESLSIQESLVKAWEILRAYAGSILLLWSALSLITVAVSAIFVIPLCVLTAGTFLSLFAVLFSSPVVGQVGMWGVRILTWCLAILIISGIETFLSATWTVAYRDLTGLGRTGV